MQNKWWSENPLTPLGLLAMRLRRRLTRHGEVDNWEPFGHISIFIDENTAHIHYVKDGKQSTLEDSAELFPSDELLAKLKVIM